MDELLASYGDDSARLSRETHTLDNTTETKKRKPAGSPPQPARKKQRMQALPALPIDIFGSEVQLLEIEQKAEQERFAKHQGRIRQFPHVEGNFPSHIYISVPYSPELHAVISELAAKLSIQLAASGATAPSESETVDEKSLWTRCDEFHISLSRPFPMRYYQIAPFTERLRTLICKSHHKLTLECHGYEYFTNDDRTRTFLALSIVRSRPLLDLLAVVDTAMEEFGFPKYYADPRPHITVAWVLGDRRPAPMSTGDRVLTPSTCALPRHFVMSAERVHAKIGKWLYEFPLHS